MTRLGLAACWATERAWLRTCPTWLLFCYAVQLARLAGVPVEFEEWVRRELGRRPRGD